MDYIWTTTWQMRVPPCRSRPRMSLAPEMITAAGRLAYSSCSVSSTTTNRLKQLAARFLAEHSPYIGFYVANGLQFVRLSGGWTSEALHPPSRQFVIGVDGHIEVTAGDGGKRSIGPGSCLLMENVEGKGHRIHVRFGHDCVVAVIPVDE